MTKTNFFLNLENVERIIQSQNYTVDKLNRAIVVPR